MEFTIYLDPYSHGGSLPKEEQKPKYLGLKKVDFIRDSLGLPDLSLSLIEAEIQKGYGSVFPVPETLARKSGRFSDSARCYIDVPHDFWDRFYLFDYKVKKNETTGEILRVVSWWEFSSHSFLKFWESNGYFTSWKIQEGTEVFAG